MRHLIFFLSLLLSMAFSQTYEVVRVVDGDTIVVSYEGQDEKVRLIGVDTPETVHPTRGEEPFGREASDFTKNALEGRKVDLEFDVQERDRYGRLLAYVWVGEEMFNRSLLRHGLAQLSTFPPNVKYVEVFTSDQEYARIAGVGMWEGYVPPACVDINSALEEELQRIIHIGPERAAEMMKLRPFRELESMRTITGIGPKRMKDIIEQGVACIGG